MIFWSGERTRLAC